MLITKHFVFVHLQKTGGTFIRDLCKEHASVLLDEGHKGAANIPEKYAHLPVFALIRNPWDWYVSWYCWVVQHLEEPGERRAQFTGEDFAEVVRGACSPDPYQRCDWDWDLYTKLWQNSFRRAQRKGMEIEVGRYENLRGDFLSFLDRYGVPGENLRRAVLRASPVNVSERSGYRDYYDDDDLRELVGRKARRIVAVYGYEF